MRGTEFVMDGMQKEKNQDKIQLLIFKTGFCSTQEAHKPGHYLER